ncbi:MAG: polysaccharide biosynthesis protein [Butyrivibrio crossotus]|nr:polysaccharide biosynthesis protein [Lachnospiraceae bacterium]MDY4028137.1 polysaccharide biosynthesis protein [Butyrivibrio crossotus]
MFQTIRKNNLILGTLMLTLAGILTRIIGFFYRIFLSRQIGEEGMGIYQLLAPIMALSFSLTCAGIQTSLSKHVAACEAENRHQKSVQTLFCAFFVSVLLSLFAGFLLCRFRIYISVAFLSEERCQNLITIYALSLPFCAIHSCINGYYFGLKKTTVPSVTQLIEQLARVCSVAILFFLFPDTAFEGKIAFAVLGLTIGEIVSSITSIFILRPILKDSTGRSTDFNGYNRAFCNLIALAAPLSLNRIILNALQSIEAAYLPRKLTEYGYTSSEALSVYGVFMGMALPMILFPQAVTSSVSVLLLPYVSEAEAKNDRKKISRSIFLATTFCVLLGFACLVFFYLTGPLIGTLIFHSEDAGLFIRTLSFMCPFLYLGTLLTSILNGLGKATLSFFIHIASISVRLLGIFILVPVFGIKAYLYFLMLSQLLYCILNFVALKKYLYYNDSGCFRNLNRYKKKHTSI